MQLVDHLRRFAEEAVEAAQRGDIETAVGALYLWLLECPDRPEFVDAKNEVRAALERLERACV